MPLSQMPKNNLVPTNNLKKVSSIWTEAISGKSNVSEDQIRRFEEKKKEYIKSMKRSGSDEDEDVSVCTSSFIYRTYGH